MAPGLLSSEELRRWIREERKGRARISSSLAEVAKVSTYNKTILECFDIKTNIMFRT